MTASWCCRRLVAQSVVRKGQEKDICLPGSRDYGLVVAISEFSSPFPKPLDPNRERFGSEYTAYPDDRVRNREVDSAPQVAENT